MTSVQAPVRRLPVPGRFAELLAKCAEPPDIPYRGISSYRLLDAGVLFARDEEISRLTQLIVVYRGALVFGQSGVGKTSMLNAGFVPEALKLGYLPERIRVRRDSAAPIVVEHIGLETAPDTTFPSNFGAEAVRGSLALSIDEFRRRLEGFEPRQGVLLVFDQFEEIITLFEDAPAREDLSGSLALQKELFDLLADLLQTSRVAVKFVFSMREDYLGRLAPFFTRVPDLRDRFVRLDPLRSDDLPSIIKGPIERFQTRYGARMPASTLDDIVARFEQRVGAGPVNLSEVQIVCRRLWDNPAETVTLDREGIGPIVDGYFNEQFTKSTAPEQTAIKSIMSCLVTSGGTRNWVSADDLLGRVSDDTGMPRPGLEQLLRDLDREGRRLVTSEERQNVVYYTILSECLVPRIRRWQEERRLAEEQARHGAAMKRLRRRLLVFAGLVILGLIGFERWRHQQKELDDKRQALEAAEARADSILALQSKTDSSFQAARQANQQAEKITSDLKRSSDSLLHAASSGTARERALSEQLRRTQAELQRVVALTDTARGSSASASVSLSRENQLLRGELARASGFAGRLRYHADRIEKMDGKLAADLRNIAAQLERMSPRTAQSKSDY
jgi:hypothetical protein